MWKFEIAWTEKKEWLNVKTGKTVLKDTRYFKGFKTREAYEKFAARLVKKGAKIVGRIEEFKKVEVK